MISIASLSEVTLDATDRLIDLDATNYLTSVGRDFGSEVLSLVPADREKSTHDLAITQD